MVRLEGTAILRTPITVKCFNSKVVRLEETENGNAYVAFPSFNSKVVRLEVAINGVSFFAFLFQFQGGAVRRCGFCEIPFLQDGFNSKVVRLEVDMQTNGLTCK